MHVNTATDNLKTNPYEVEPGRFDSTKENVANTPKEMPDLTDAEVKDTIVVDSIPQPKPPMTRKEWGKMMKLYFTRRNNTVAACGHKFVEGHQPNNNCEFCWFAFFQVHGDIAKTADECFRSTDGEQMLIRVKGEKFTKMFKRFMSTLAKFIEEQKETDGKVSGDTEASGQVGDVQEVVGSGDTAEQEAEHN